jgi:hypothetical protein
MTRHASYLAAALTLVACQRAPAPPSVAPAPSAPAAAASTPAECAAQGSLDRMDKRVAVPLLPMMANHQKQNMRDHLRAVQEIVLAAANDDFAAIESATRRIGFSEQMGAMCTHMGAGAPGFTEQALAFHHTADGIGAAAHRRDRKEVMKALGTTLQACTGCHETFRQSVVDEAAWSRLTQMAPPPMAPPSGG